ncbi:glycoside hydrolase superfamily [Aspergillus granulosus]|uniref:xylan 1,4-beta-xylosidase n=1 Tax=Aspergillus granulosus TaxID=176169 RepID=A0ABR4GRK0_9EURO
MRLADPWQCLSALSLGLTIPALSLAQTSYPDCSKAPLNYLAICNTTIDPLTRARSLISALTLEEKIANTGHEASGAPRLGLPPYNWWNEALHGVAEKHGVTFEDEGEFSYATSFPAPIVLGAAFNDDLVRTVADIISIEARAFSNSDHAGLDYWTPNVNPFKDPRWGRGQETPGEDPLHLSRYVREFVTGLQGDDPANPKVLATCKHLAAYDMEEWGGVSRFEFNAKVSVQDLVEYYLPPFKTCAMDADVGAFMCSYNAVNGVPGCADQYFLQTVLREHWGWGEKDGHWVTGDCNAIERMQTWHHYFDDEASTAAGALNAGVDLDCGSHLQSHLGDAVAQGLVSNETLDTALERLYTSLVQLGYFDPAEGQPLRDIGWESVSTETAGKAAWEVATQGSVLLKNIGGALPLKTNRTLALIGPYINFTTQMQSNYAGPARYIPTMIEAAKKLGYDISTAEGTKINSTSGDGFDEALSIASESDEVIFFGGMDNSIEEESLDRTSIDWPGNQEELIIRLAETGKPLTVVQFGGGQLDDSQLLANENVSAILWVGYPSEAGGVAVFDVLTGRVAPAGRLPITQYPKSYVDEVPMTDMNLRPGEGNPGRTYRWYEDAVLPFGFGLHYTTFEVSWAKQKYGPYKSAALAKGSRPDLNQVDMFSLVVTNTGDVTSDYVALIFASAPDAGPQPAPIKTLVGYTRERHIKPGETRKINIEVTISSLTRALADGSVVLYPGRYQLIVDVDQNYPTASFSITGKPQVIERFPIAGKMMV